ncbi:DUF1398 domain-containing protein [Flavobacterium wongokense]|uniref:DUF1398 domain-containing protein n=1 Tax=Flavobacterium wongokense TaxID=2910674 RepID=UPI001F3964DC|nr:DUF1398 family protein [Flavobacterium sp. WG47]MCF6131319.1 DUF1398 domain-containing protein [Flavobacterium sp. WG47]
MFTIQQIKEAHSKVKSGADFPQYMRDLIELGITAYETFVFDSHTDYQGENNFSISSEGNHEILSIAVDCNPEQFKSDLKAHQQGQTDFPMFRKDCAKSGIEKWIVVMDKKTCSYYDKAGNEVLVETIPI